MHAELKRLQASVAEASKPEEVEAEDEADEDFDEEAWASALVDRQLAQF